MIERVLEQNKKKLLFHLSSQAAVVLLQNPWLVL